MSIVLFFCARVYFIQLKKAHKNRAAWCWAVVVEAVCLFLCS